MSSPRDYERNQVIDAAIAQVKSLQDERKARPTNNHPSDSRIPSEISQTQLKIGDIKVSLVNEITAYEAHLAELKNKVSLVSEIQKGLHYEYQVAVRMIDPNKPHNQKKD